MTVHANTQPSTFQEDYSSTQDYHLEFQLHPSIFQRVLEGVIKDIPRAFIYFDDILISGDSQEEHLATLELVLSRLEEAGLRLKREKCSFLQRTVSYLGHVLDEEGIHPDQAKVEAVKLAPHPKNVAELRSFLGLVNYYGRFLPQLASTLAPLNGMLRKRTPWHWGDRQ